MTELEARRLMATLNVYFGGRITKETMVAWAKEMKSYTLDDAITGVREHARTAPHPQLADLLLRIEEARQQRAVRERQKLDTAALPANASPDPEQEERLRAARAKAREAVLGVKSMPAATASSQPRAPRRHETMTDEEIAARKQKLAEQAAMLEREEEAAQRKAALERAALIEGTGDER